uniref:Uncharacterized protein n=2 Tax=Tetraselmis sp. GSL018 TaxID=582737 RepID=A0A061RA28_9CHLO|eukprot:CAMPEP_0177596846 /NCGR_PEP_ID=MMETSP0419_2-20121207/11363_1 /TAXON_ID=582737 /ORGANISM="Tetraselmis sp., Strain GSL018" /LENGTH=761 /DNA_ID=CAMNT_0019088911 /DNA_START=216 /DNA_END=2501 /DNA_ORIENTATION=+
MELAFWDPVTVGDLSGPVGGLFGSSGAMDVSTAPLGSMTFEDMLQWMETDIGKEFGGSGQNEVLEQDRALSGDMRALINSIVDPDHNLNQLPSEASAAASMSVCREQASATGSMHQGKPHVCNSMYHPLMPGTSAYPHHLPPQQLFSVDHHSSAESQITAAPAEHQSPFLQAYPHPSSGLPAQPSQPHLQQQFHPQSLQLHHSQQPQPQPHPPLYHSIGAPLQYAQIPPGLYAPATQSWSGVSPSYVTSGDPLAQQSAMMLNGCEPQLQLVQESPFPNLPALDTDPHGAQRGQGHTSTFSPVHLPIHETLQPMDPYVATEQMAAMLQQAQAQQAAFSHSAVPACSDVAMQHAVTSEQRSSISAPAAGTVSELMGVSEEKLRKAPEPLYAQMLRTKKKKQAAPSQKSRPSVKTKMDNLEKEIAELQAQKSQLEEETDNLQCRLNILDRMLQLRKENNDDELENIVRLDEQMQMTALVKDTASLSMSDGTRPATKTIPKILQKDYAPATFEEMSAQHKASVERMSRLLGEIDRQSLSSKMSESPQTTELKQELETMQANMMSYQAKGGGSLVHKWQMNLYEQASKAKPNVEEDFDRCYREVYPLLHLTSDQKERIRIALQALRNRVRDVQAEERDHLAAMSTVSSDDGVSAVGRCREILCSDQALRRLRCMHEGLKECHTMFVLIILRRILDHIQLSRLIIASYPFIPCVYKLAQIVDEEHDFVQRDVDVQANEIMRMCKTKCSAVSQAVGRGMHSGGHMNRA